MDQVSYLLLELLFLLKLLYVHVSVSVYEACEFVSMHVSVNKYGHLPYRI